MPVLMQPRSLAEHKENRGQGRGETMETLKKKGKINDKTEEEKQVHSRGRRRLQALTSPPSCFATSKHCFFPLSFFFFFFASAVSRNKASLKKRFFFYFSPNVLASGRTLPPGKSRRRNTREVSFRANTAQQKKNTGCSPQLCCEGCEDNAFFCSLLKKISERLGVNFTAVKL